MGRTQHREQEDHEISILISILIFFDVDAGAVGLPKPRYQPTPSRE
jgi:hypothetical protein